VGISYSELVTTCLCVSLSVFPENLIKLNEFPSTVSFADADVSCLLGIKIILFRLLTQNQLYISVSKHEIPLF